MSNKPSITAHMIVKNDDRFVWYAIQSVLPYVDSFHIVDTGSTDATVACIEAISSQKIKFEQRVVNGPDELVRIRQQQLEATRSDWLWMVDGDEIYPSGLCDEIKHQLRDECSGIIVRRYDALGDIFHYQADERVGGYSMFGQTAHYSLRLVNCHIPGLKILGTYPNEGFFDSKNIRLVDYPSGRFYVTELRYVHATYLNRSSCGSNLSDTLHRMKYKVELGVPLSSQAVPEVFEKKPPAIVTKPKKRSFGYELAAGLITPLKQVKRTLLK